MMTALHGAELISRARDFESQTGVRHTEAGGLIALLSKELESTTRLAEHLASEALGLRCELTDPFGNPSGRCPGRAIAIRWEDGFADDVCEEHAGRVKAEGALVIYPKRHDGQTG